MDTVHHAPARAAERNGEQARARHLLIVEDELVVLRDMRHILTSAGYAVSGTASTLRTATDWLADHTPDLALIDISLPEGPAAGLTLAESLVPRRVPVLFVSAHSDSQTVARAKAVGPVGYLVKPFTGEQLVTAVSFALDHVQPSRPAGVAAAIASIDERLHQLTALLTPTPSPTVDVSARVDALPGLSARERDVLRLLSANRRVPQIAEKLFISQHTVRSHLKSMFHKLGVRNQAELISLVIDAPPQI